MGYWGGGISACLIMMISVLNWVRPCGYGCFELTDVCLLFFACVFYWQSFPYCFGSGALLFALLLLGL